MEEPQQVKNWERNVLFIGFAFTENQAYWINEQISQLKKIEDEYKEKRIQVMEAIEQSIKNIGQNPAITPLGKNTFTIPMSELFNPRGHPLSIIGKCRHNYSLNYYIKEKQNLDRIHSGNSP